MTRINENGIITNIRYDKYGNTIQTNKATITYNSRNLMESYITNNNEKYIFTYNYQGIRCRKEKENGYKVNYYLDGTRIIGEDLIDNDNHLIRKFRYYYDIEGICGIDYIVDDNNDGKLESHYYNLIKDSSGNIAKIMYRGKYIGEYTYDAWGNCEINYLSSANELDEYVINNNPFRYKGYYYDVETNLALVSSRYYSPELGRFIQPADVSSLNPQSINGLNLYTYAVNNPISIKYDSSVSSYGSGMVSSIDFGALSTGTSSISNQAAPEWLKLLVGAIPDLKVGLDYLTAHGTKSSFAYATAKTYRFPILGGTHSAFTKGKYSYGDLVGASFRKIATDSARGGFGAFAKNFAKTSVYTLGVNFAFNLYENNWQIDDAMIQDTLIDTAIGVSSYYMAAGTMSLLTAGALVAFGWNVPGLIVVGGVVVLSIAYDALIRWITGYDE